MEEGKKIDEIERLLAELKASKEQSAVTVDTVKGRPIRILARRETLPFLMEEIIFGHRIAYFAATNRIAVCGVLHVETREYIHGR